MNKRSEKHQFSCYYEQLDRLITPKPTGSECTINEPIVSHRIASILRLQKGDLVTLFNRAMHVTISLTRIDKKSCTGTIYTHAQNHILVPPITILLPLLKKDALEDALYSCVELGATNVQLIATKKTHHISTDTKQMARLHAIIIAAAEQSKQYLFPLIQHPINLSRALEDLPLSTRIFFHPTGLSFRDVIHQIDRAATGNTHYVIMIGPEGDCTEEERTQLSQHQFIHCRLTPTVLRSRQALAVGLGAIRSMVTPP